MAGRYRDVTAEIGLVRVYRVRLALLRSRDPQDSHTPSCGWRAETVRGQDQEGGLMDSDDFLDDLSESSLTQEDWVRFFQLQARYMAPPEDPSIVRFTGDGQKIAIWLLNRYRTLAEMFRFLRERLDKNYVAKEGADRDLEDVSIEIWANIVARYANGYLQQRLTASVNAALKGVITEMYEAEPAIIEAALGQNTKEAVNPNLPSRADIRRIWSQIIDEHLDKAFVRENRGGDRRSERTITEDEK